MKEIKKIKPVSVDDRGKIIDVIDGEEFVHAGIVTFTPGAVRANHYHKKTVQVNYVLKGKIKYQSKDLVNGGEVEEVILEEGDMITSGVLEWHSLEGIEESIVLFFTEKSRQEGGYEDDVFRVSREEIKDFKIEG